MTTVGAVVVNYNARDHLVACVASLQAEAVDEIVVADNDSTDGSAVALAEVGADTRFVPMGSNLGYGAAANRGAAQLRSEFVMVCNPDLTVEPGAVKVLLATLEADARTAIVGPRIENTDGTLYPSPRRFPSITDALGHAFLGSIAPGNRFTRRYRMLDWDRAAPGPVDWVSGSCFLVRRRAWDELGGFDERYFMYAEDVDLCWRSWRAGWKVAFEPAARVVHVQGASTDLAPYRMIVEHHRSLFRFAQRSTTGWQRALLPLVAFGLILRLALTIAQRSLQARRAR